MDIESRKEPFLQAVLSLLREQLKDQLPAIRDAVLKSGREFVVNSRKDLGRWNDMLASGVLTVEEYGWLVESRLSVAELRALEAAGLAMTRIDEIRRSILRSVTGAALSLIGL